MTNIELLDGEQCAYVKNTNNRYIITSHGRLITTGHYGSKRHAVMKPAKDKKGYLRTCILIDNKPTTIKVHRVVAIHFIENPMGKDQVNHKDGNKTNNHVSNLEWCTQSENIQHAFDTGLSKWNGIKPPHKYGSLNGCAKLNEQQVAEIRQKFKPRVYTREMLAKEYGVSPHTIKDAILRRWKHVK